MYLSIDQTKKILGNVSRGVNPQDVLKELVGRGYEIEGMDMQSAKTQFSNDAVTKATEGNQFANQERQGLVEGISGGKMGGGKVDKFFGGVRDFATGVVGGGKTAEGAGMAIASSEVQGQLSEAQKMNSDIQLNLAKQIKELKANGQDTTRLENALQTARATSLSLQDAQSDFTEALPSNKQVIGSSARLATSLATPTVTRGLTGGKAASGTMAGIKQGAKIGAAEGALQGAGIGAEQDLSTGGIIGSAVTGGVTGGIVGGVVGGVSGRFKASSDLKKQKEALLRSNPDSTVAQYTLDGQGKIVNDPVAKEVIKQGVDEGTVATIKGSSQADKQAMNKALDILEKADTDKKFAALNRSSDVIGETAMKRFSAVNEINQNAAQQLDDVAKSLKGNQINPIPAVRAFADDLSDLGVTFQNGKAVYTGSQIEGVKPAQSLIDKVIKRINNVGDDAFDMHNFKKFLDEQVAYGKTAEGLSGRTESIIKGLRSNIDELLDTSFPRYNEVNTQYSLTRNAIDDFLGAAGSKFDVTKPGAEKQVGTLMRRILSNAQSRVQVTNAMQNMQEVAKAFGKEFDDDVITQLVFVDELERLFGSQAPTSLQGITEKVAKTKGIASRLKSAEGIFDLALQAGGEAIDKARGVNREGLVKSLREILSN